MFKAGEFIKRLSVRNKLGILGVFISLVSIFIVNFSILAFSIIYLLGVFLIFISSFIGIEKFNKNTIGEIISRIGLVFIMLGIFSRMDIIENIIASNIQIAGTLLMLVGISLRSMREGEKKNN